MAKKDERRACPRCGEAIMRSATVCRFCQAQVEPIVAPRKSGVPKPVLLIGLLVLLGIIVANQNSSGSSDRSNRSTTNSNLVGRFVSWEPVDDSSGYANFTITNRGSSSATAECSVRVSNDFGDFGFDSMVGERVPAGEAIALRMALDVGEGSFTINDGEITDC